MNINKHYVLICFYNFHSFEDSSNITIPRWDNNMSGYSNPQTFSKYSVYNKALTAEEVTQNYNATKQRYVK